MFIKFNKNENLRKILYIYALLLCVLILLKGILKHWWSGLAWVYTQSGFNENYASSLDSKSESK